MEVFSENKMFNLVINNRSLEAFESDAEVRKVVQIFNDTENYVENIIEQYTEERQKQIKIKRFVHNELLKKTRDILQKEFRNEYRSMDVSMWRYFMEAHAETYLRQYIRLDDDEECMET